MTFFVAVAQSAGSLVSALTEVALPPACVIALTTSLPRSGLPLKFDDCLDSSGRQALCNGGPDAAARASHDRHFPGEMLGRHR